MKLRDLDASFLRILDEKTDQRVDTLAGANGVIFQCPKCAERIMAGGTPIKEMLDYHGVGRTYRGVPGAHYVICWFTGVDPKRDPKPGRWNPQGTGLDDLTFVGPGSFSVQLLGGCNWHGFVRNGEATPS